MSILCRAVLPLLVSLIGGIAGAGTDADAQPAPDTALLVIDIQEFYFPGGGVPLVGPEAAARQAGLLLAAFRTAGQPVVHVQHLPQDVAQPDATGIAPPYRIHPGVLPQPGEPVIGKHHANAFRATSLLETLRSLGVERLVIAGMQTHMCVEAAARAAADLGFEVVVVADACATRALSYGGVEVPAAQVHAAALAALDGTYARVISTESLLAELAPAPSAAGEAPPASAEVH